MEIYYIYLVHYKKEKNSTFPHLRFNCVLARWNIEDVSEYLEFVYSLGADSIDFRNLIVYTGLNMENQSLNMVKSLTNEYLDIARSKCNELGIQIYAMPNNFVLDSLEETQNKDGNSEPYEYICTVPQDSLFITADWDLLPCCFWLNELPMGNLMKNDFDAIWNNKEYIELRDEVAQGIFKRTCCQNCAAYNEFVPIFSGN